MQTSLERQAAQRFRIRETAALLILFLGFLVNTLHTVSQEISKDQASKRGILRMAVARNLVPPMSVLGYVGAPQYGQGRTKVNLEAMERFELARYSLAPALVESREDAELAIADLYDPDRARLFAGDRRWVVVRDCGSGILLVKRKR